MANDDAHGAGDADDKVTDEAASAVEAERVALQCGHCQEECEALVESREGEIRVAYAVSHCDHCGNAHPPGCWGRCDVERDPGAEERLRMRDPERLERLDQLRADDCKAQGPKAAVKPRMTGPRPVPPAPRARVPPVRATTYNHASTP